MSGRFSVGALEMWGFKEKTTIKDFGCVEEVGVMVEEVKVVSVHNPEGQF